MSEMKNIKVVVWRDPTVNKALAEYLDLEYKICTLYDLWKQCASDLPEAEITLNGEIQERCKLEYVEVEPGDEIIIKPYPGFWPAFFAWVGPMVAQAALAVAFSYLGGLIFQQNPPEDDRTTGSDDQSFGWNPKSTQSEGIPIPLAYGKNLHHGNIVSRWTQVDGDDNEILYLKICHGEGPTQGVDLNRVYLNDQPVGNFSDVTVQQRKGTDNQTAMTGFESDKVEIRSNNEITYDEGAQTFSLPRSGFDQIEFTLGFDRGIFGYTEMGDQVAHSLRVKVEIAEVGSGSWTSLLSNSTITKNQQAPYYIDYSTDESSLGFSVDRTKHYQLRVTKLTEDQSASRYGDELRLRSYRGVVETAFTHPGKALIGITAKASDRLSGNIDVSCVREDKIVRVYNGTSWAWQYSNNRAWAVYNMLTQPSITGDGDGTAYDVEFYEGFQTSQIDTAFFYEWAELCDTAVSDGDGGTIALSPCNHIIDTASELWGLVYSIASIGRAKLYWEGTTLSGWLDEEWTGDLEIITSNNIIEGSWSQEWTHAANKPGTIVVDYQDEDRGYKRIKWPVSNEDSGSYANKIDIQGIGIKNRALATRVGAFILERGQLINEFDSFRMYKDALMYQVGEVYLIQHNRPNWGKAYRIQDADSSTGVEITLDRDVTESAGETIYIRSYNSDDGEVATVSYTIASVSGAVVTLTSGLTQDVSYKDLVAIGSTTQLKQRRITSIQWNPDHTFTIIVEKYDADLWDIDSVEPNDDYPEYTQAHTENKLAEPISKFETINLIKNSLPPQLNIDIPLTNNLTWTHTGSSGTAGWEATDGTNPIYFKYRGNTYEITADDAKTEEFIFWDPNYTTIFRTTSDINTAIASGNWVMAINDGDAIHPAHAMQLIHAGLLLAGTIRAEAYAELRQTMPWNAFDSGDATHPVTLNFKIPSETTDIISAKLSFRIENFRAYSTTVASAEAEAGTSGNTDVGDKVSGGPAGYSWNAATGNVTSGDERTTSQVAAHTHDITGATENEDGTGSHNHDLNQWNVDSSSENAHTHEIPDNHRHDLTSVGAAHTHSTTIGSHSHSVTIPSHSHGLTFGIYEESNSVNVHYHIDDGSGFGSASGSYNGDQLDIDITAGLTGVGWKAVRFDVDARCRINSILEVKVDITA